LETQKKTSLNIDLKQTTMIPMPQFIQQDTNVLEFDIKENGEAADLSNIGRIVVNYKRPDGKVISRLLSVEENTVSYSIGVEEMQVAGYAEIELQFYSKDNLQRISTKRFKVSMSKEIGTREIGDTEGTLTILQELFVEVESLVADTEAAAQHANDEAEYARAKGNYADEKAKLAATEASNLETLKADVVDATNAANTAAQYATETALGASVEAVNVAENAGAEAKQTAYTAAANADEKAAMAQTQADYAKEQGDIAKQKQAELEGLSVVQYNDRLVKVENELSDSNRQSQNLQHGVQVINASADSLADFEIAGRTLIPMASTPLRGGMFYVLADKRTIIAIDGQRKQGVTKFQKGSTATTTTANFSGKVAGSTASNPHKAYVIQSAVDLMPVSGGVELDDSSSPYSRLKNLDGLTYNNGMQDNGTFVQMRYDFDVIEQIERNMNGRVPGKTVAEKAAWLNSNIETVFNWHGYAQGPSGYNVAVRVWDTANSRWTGTAGSSANRISLLSLKSVDLGTQVDANGFAHFLAFGPKAGDTMSNMYIDYLELVITLKAGAQLDTRPQIIRIANFQDKVAGSTVENPHKYMKRSQNGLASPNQFTFEGTQFHYDRVSKLDGGLDIEATTVNGYSASMLHSFNLIEEYERNVGKIPGSTTAQKVQWLKDNLKSLACNWHGIGSSVGGNKANLTMYRFGSLNSYQSPTAHTNATVTKLTRIFDSSYSQDSVANAIDPSGFVHFLAYAEPSDGTTASTINTDYVELEIELKPGADIHHPVVPLYEVTQVEYDNILVAWDEMAVLSRYPKVQGMQHLQNPAVIAEGENLLPPFYEWTLHANAKVISPYELELNATAQGQRTNIEIPVIPNQNYTISCADIPNVESRFYVSPNSDGVTGALLWLSTYSKVVTFNSGNNSKLWIVFHNRDVSKHTIKNPMLTLGDKPKPFTPRNPSYLFAQVKLGQIGDKKDILFRQDGNWMVRKELEKDLSLDGSLAWAYGDMVTGVKRVGIFGYGARNQAVILKYDGISLKRVNDSYNAGADTYSPNNDFYMNISNVNSGWGDSYTPSSDDIKRYFNGWKYQDGTTWISVTGNGQTATAATALTTKPTDYVPYKLSYVLATPKVEVVTDKVEGDIAVNGPTQVEVTSGVVVREKIPNPKLISGTYYLNTNPIFNGFENTQLKYKNEKILGLYKNSVRDSNWNIESVNAYGKQRALISQSNFDPTAEYTVTYLVLDRHLFTVNATEVKAFFDKSMKSVVDKLVEREADNATLISIINKQMYDILVRLKAGGI
jgi:hypothetical protein